jgi:hypothetical protein
VGQFFVAEVGQFLVAVDTPMRDSLTFSLFMRSVDSLSSGASFVRNQRGTTYSATLGLRR